MKKPRNIIVIGASAGGLPAIQQVAAGLSGQMDIAVLVVLHVSRKSNGDNIARVFQRHTSLNCRMAKDGEPIERGCLYVARPDHHLMIKDDLIQVTQGPHENRYRPSVDMLFRSAAVYFGHKVIGVILTGLLEDGTSGMSAIKRCGGICIVQDPKDAEHDDMPLSVLNQVAVDHQARLADMAVLLEEILHQQLPPKKPVPAELKIEVEITEKRMSSIDQLKKIGEQSNFVCPDCGGGLWALKNDPTHRYRCHTGHCYSENKLYELQGDNIEESIYVSLRMLEERRNLLQLMASHSEESGKIEIAAANRDRAEEMEVHIDRLKSALSKLTASMQK
jgi:two-component system chemotaxis response regulator CheB